VAVDIDAVSQPISISSEDIEHALHVMEGKLDERVERVINRVLEQMAPDILRSLYSSLPDALQERHAIQRGF
jgi:hypothetical protein